MSQLLEALGKGLVSSLWCIFGKSLQDFETNFDGLRPRLAERPDDQQLLLSAAVTCYRQQQYGQALEHVEKLQLDNGPYSCKAAEIQACILEALGKRSDAIDVLMRAERQLDLPDPVLLFAVGMLYETAGQTDRAVDHYTRVIEIRPNFRNARQRLAAIALAAGQLDRAVDHYQQLCNDDPADTEACVLLASMLVNDGQTAQAIARYQLALTIEPDNWPANNDLAEAFIKTGQHEKAITVLKDALDKHDHAPDIHLQLAQLEAELGDDQQAVSHYQKAIEIHPGYLEAIVRFGTHHLQMQRYLDAAELFSQAVEVNDRLLNAYVGLAVAQQHAGDHDQAQQSIELATAVEPNSTMLFAELAKLELKASAAEQIKDYLSGHPDAPQGGCKMLDVQTERFAQAVEEHDDRADWHYRYGLLLKAQGHVADAADEFDRAVQINPNYVKALVKLGLTLHELGDPERARCCLHRAVVLEPGYADTYYQLGLIYADQGRYHLAVEQFDQSLKRNGSNVQTHAALAQALENVGLGDRARASWRAVIELAPESEQAKLAVAALQN